MKLRAPFPYYGGKALWSKSIWAHFGNHPEAIYSEPFFGSGAVLLDSPTTHLREVVCDTDGNLCNFWRSIRSNPDQVAQLCYPLPTG